jgi:hypothetical protein
MRLPRAGVPCRCRCKPSVEPFRAQDLTLQRERLPELDAHHSLRVPHDHPSANRECLFATSRCTLGRWSIAPLAKGLLIG